MNRSETSHLLATISLIDNRGVTDETVLAWHAILGDLPYRDAADAAAEHLRTPGAPWLLPSHIVAGVKRIREARDREREAREREAISARADERRDTRPECFDEMILAARQAVDAAEAAGHSRQSRVASDSAMRAASDVLARYREVDDPVKDRMERETDVDG